MKKIFVTFILSVILTAPGWAKIRVYPVPWVSSRHQSNPITFTDLPASGTIKIFTVSGEEVVELSIPTDGQKEWDGKNASGRNVASGIYLYVVNGDNQKTTGKLVVIR